MSFSSIKRASVMFQNFQVTTNVLQALSIDPIKENYIRQVPNAHFSLVKPTPISQPSLLLASPTALKDLTGIDMEQMDRSSKDYDLLLDYFCGNRLMEHSQPAAHCYCGYQFGFFSGQLGDGAAIYLGEMNDGKYELQLKGAGLTPYSHTADGRKVLRSSLREFLASEHLHALGIPTTRAGTIILSLKDCVVRDQFYNGNPKFEPIAVISRIAPSFFRFGSFEICKSTNAMTGCRGPSSLLPKEQQKRLLCQLADYIIRVHYPDLLQQNASKEEIYYEFYRTVVNRTASLVALWQSFGFCHGVLNTDNMSILGLTIDYGPYGFMEYYDKHYVSNTSDENGRYAFEAQVEICKWNCQKLAESLQLLFNDAQTALHKMDDILEQEYDATFQETYYTQLYQKFGMEKPVDPSQYQMDQQLFDDFFDLLDQMGCDLTCAFRNLTTWRSKQQNNLAEELVAVCIPREQLTKPNISTAQYEMIKAISMRNPRQLQLLGIPPNYVSQIEAKLTKYNVIQTQTKQDKLALWQAWIDQYRTRIIHEKESTLIKMKQSNPIYILRNHIAQKAIEYAEQHDTEKVQAIFELLLHPYEERSGYEIYQYPTSDPKHQCLKVSCSS